VSCEDGADETQKKGRDLRIQVSFENVENMSREESPDRAALRMRLCNLRAADVGRFLPRPERCLAKICRVHDGDTLTILGIVAGEPTLLQLRVRNVDAPELRGRSPEEMSVAARLRDLLRTLLVDSVSEVVVEKLDKYGRCLGDVRMPRDPAKWLSEFLLEKQLVRAYDGAGRLPFQETELKKIVASMDTLAMIQRDM
jgi:endonuclease YncB( thermonuclease family)